MAKGRRGGSSGGSVLRLLGRVLHWSILAGLAAIVLVVALGALYSQVMPVSTLMLARWATFRSAERIAVPLDAISPNLPRAVLASEDAPFCQHNGVDWDVLRQVIEDADEEDGPSRGASTITMQTAKNLFLWNGRSYLRKGLEIPIALYLDRVLGKRRVLEIYLNVAEWGEGIFGAEAAARRHFGKSARNLTAHEAALLATALPNPIRRNAGRPSAIHRRLAARLLSRMNAAGAPMGCIERGQSVADRG